MPDSVNIPDTNMDSERDMSGATCNDHGHEGLCNNAVTKKVDYVKLTPTGTCMSGQGQSVKHDVGQQKHMASDGTCAHNKSIKQKITIHGDNIRFDKIVMDTRGGQRMIIARYGNIIKEVYELLYSFIIL